MFKKSGSNKDLAKESEFGRR